MQRRASESSNNSSSSSIGSDDHSSDNASISQMINFINAAAEIQQDEVVNFDIRETFAAARESDASFEVASMTSVIARQQRQSHEINNNNNNNSNRSDGTSLLPNWSTSIEQRGRQNVARLDEYQQVQQQLEYCQRQLEKLTKQHTERIQQTLLYFEPCEKWPKLKRRYTKKIILTCLTSPYAIKLPEALTESQWRQHVPTKLRDDLDLLLARANRPEFAAYYRTVSSSNGENKTTLELPDNALDDKRIILQLLKVYPEGLYYCDRKLSEKLRKDPYVIAAALRIPAISCNTDQLQFLRQFSFKTQEEIDFLLLHATKTKSFNFITKLLPRKKSSDRQLAKELATKCGHIPNDALAFFVNDVRRRRDVVSAYVTRNGRNLQHATKSLRGRTGIVRLACESYPGAFAFALDPAREELRHDVDFMLNLLRNPINNEKTSKELFEMCPTSIKTERSIALCAMNISRYAYGLSRGLKDTTPFKRCRNNRSFWEAAVSRYSIEWNNIPYKFQDAELAKIMLRRVDSWTDIDLVNYFFEKFPTTPFLQDREIVLAIVRNLDHEDALLFWERSAFFRDKEIVMILAKRSPILVDYLTFDDSSPLLLDVDILRQCILSHPLSIQHFPPSLQMRHPELVVLAIQSACPYDLYVMYEELDIRVWANIDVAKAWILNGGDFHDYFPDDYTENRELFLLVAEHHPTDFFCASERLCSDKEFMIQAVAKRGSLIREVSSYLVGDFDIMLSAFGNNPVLCRDYVTPSNNNVGIDSSLLTFAQQLRKKMYHYEGFLQFMYGCYTTGLIGANQIAKDSADIEVKPSSSFDICPSQVVHSKKSKDTKEDTKNSMAPSSNVAVESTTTNGRSSARSRRSQKRDKTNRRGKNADLTETRQNYYRNNDRRNRRKRDENKKKGDRMPCPLQMLNQGGETLQIYLKTIAAYADVPLGDELCLMRQASANLELWGL